jgi:hypothetical protein
MKKDTIYNVYIYNTPLLPTSDTFRQPKYTFIPKKKERVYLPGGRLRVMV